MIKQALAGLVALAALSGCAESYQHTVVRDAVSSRVFLHTPATPGDAELGVVRTNGLFGGGCAARLRIDGVLAAQLQQGESARFHVAPGQHQLDLESVGTCSRQVIHRDLGLAAGQRVDLTIGSHGTSLTPLLAARS